MMKTIATTKGTRGKSKATGTSALALRLTAGLKDALARSETTDFQELDQLLVEGVSTAQLKRLPREQLHRLLVFALSETVLADSAKNSKDWVLDAVQLFLSRAAAASH